MFSSHHKSMLSHKHVFNQDAISVLKLLAKLSGRVYRDPTYFENHGLSKPHQIRIFRKIGSWVCHANHTSPTNHRARANGPQRPTNPCPYTARLGFENPSLACRDSRPTWARPVGHLPANVLASGGRRPVPPRRFSGNPDSDPTNPIIFKNLKLDHFSKIYTFHAILSK